MTINGYARLPFSWRDDVVLWEALSGEAVRLLVFATLESAAGLTDGWLSARSLRAIDRDEAVEELVERGYLQPDARVERGVSIEGYRLSEFLNEQKSRAERDAEKQAVRDRVSAHRARKRGAKPVHGQDDPARVTASVTRYSGSTSRVTQRGGNEGSRSESGSGSRSGRATVVASIASAAVNGVVGSGAARRLDEKDDAPWAPPPDSGHLVDQGDNSHCDSVGGKRNGFVLPATPFHTPQAPPRGMPAEVNGSENYGAPLHVTQAAELIEGRISPQRFVVAMRNKAERSGWERLDWEALVSRQRFSRALALRPGEAEALLPQIEAWEAEGAL